MILLRNFLNRYDSLELRTLSLGFFFCLKYYKVKYYSISRIFKSINKEANFKFAPCVIDI